MDITYAFILGSYTLYKYIKGRDALAEKVEGKQRGWKEEGEEQGQVC